MSMLDYAHARADMTTGIPRGVGAPPPPGLDPKRGKLMCIKVRMLDDCVAVFHLGHKAIGQTLLDEVSRHLNLLETDYFGLEFIDSMRNRCWLDKDKAIVRQIASSDAKFYFVVKFYSPNPIDLEEEYTRYLLTLQIRRDLATGDLHCSESTAALLSAYLVQSDCGDFSSEDYPDATYLSHSRFIPDQTYEFQQKIMENHRNLIGMSPGESDLALLEVARRCDYYGIKFHVAKDIEGTEANLAVMHLGIKVFHQLHCVSTFSWAKIRKLSFKRKKLLIKLHPDSYQYYKETIEFVFETRNECKNFWKKCVEHHAFFRCTSVENSKKDGRLFSKGSSFRYNGRTQKQLIDYVREHHKRREPFTRPLRSAGTLSSRGDYVSSGSVKYSVVREKKANGSRHDHRSMPHLSAGIGGGGSTTSGTLDARVMTSHHQTASAVASSSAQANSNHLNYINNNNNNNNNNASNNQTHLKNSLTDCENNTFRSNLKTHDRTETSNSIFKEQTAENISLSLPNVLSDDIQVVCRELDFENNAKHPPKSVSGDNFLDLIEKSNDYDNVSEDSYRLSDNERSFRSDIAAHTNQQIFNTTFTTKRIGNVVVKRVVSQTKSTPNTTDDEDSEHLTSTRSDIEPRSHSQSRRRPVKEYPFFSTTVVPIEIDGPNVDLKARLQKSSIPSAISTLATSNLTRKPIYTSSGALLVKPKVISTECDNLSSISAPYASVKVSPDSSTYSTIVSPIVREVREEHSIRVSGPLPGKILSKENMVVTPDGLKERRQKPAVPPKPKIPEHGVKPKAEVIGHPVVHMPQEFSRESSEDRSISAAPLPPPPSSARASSSVAASSSHHEVPQSIPLASNVATDEDVSTSRKILNRPALISVKSEDSPEIEKCHLYNSEIPYTLTLRNLDSRDAETFETTSLKRPTKSTLSEAALVFERRKSLDLVPRKRLPSPGNFSSQDHSISPTTPDGDVLEYLLRRRSMSQDRSSISKKGKRGDIRRQTQPVRFDLPAHSPAYSPTTTSSTPFISFLNDDVDDCMSESRSLHDDMDRLDKQTQSISSLNIEERAGSEESDALPPPPSNLPKKAAPPPPPPKSKKAANRVVEIKATTVLSLSDVPDEQMSARKLSDELKNWSEQSNMIRPEERLSSLERQIQDFAGMTNLPMMCDKSTDSPPFIDDSPKEEIENSSEEGPSSIRTASGLIVTDF